MGTTAEKLSYLNGTKRLLRRRLNSLGASITLDTRFRDYQQWLDKFFDAAASSLDFKMLGETTQESGHLVNVSGEQTYTATDGETFPVHLKSFNIFDKSTVHWYRNDGNEFSNKTNTSSNYMRTDAFPVQSGVLDYYLYGLPEGVSLSGIIAFKNTSGDTTTYSIAGNRIRVNSSAKYIALKLYGTGFTDETVQEMENAEIVLTTLSYDTGEYDPYYDIKLCEVNGYQDKLYSIGSSLYLLKETGYIESYNGEALPDDYITSTGTLETGVEVVYALDTPTKTKLPSDYMICYYEFPEILSHEVPIIINDKILWEE